MEEKKTHTAQHGMTVLNRACMKVNFLSGNYPPTANGSETKSETKHETQKYLSRAVSG